MAMTVRFPNGQEVTYNDACYLNYKSQGWELYTKDPDKGGSWIVSIQQSSGAIVESMKPCKVQNPLTNVTGEKALEYVIAYITELSKTYSGAKLVKKLKKKLVQYSTRSGKWSA